LRASAESLLPRLFPPDCRFCRISLIDITRLADFKRCASRIHSLAGNVSEGCGERLASLQASAYGDYDGVLRELIHLFQYDQVRPVCTGSAASSRTMKQDAQFKLKAPMRQGWVAANSLNSYAREVD